MALFPGLCNNTLHAGVLLIVLLPGLQQSKYFVVTAKRPHYYMVIIGIRSCYYTSVKLGSEPCAGIVKKYSKRPYIDGVIISYLTSGYGILYLDIGDKDCD